MSVVIATYNRRNALARLLQSLQSQTIRQFEVVVVNGPSTDGTSDVLDAYGTAIKRGTCTETNIGAARNIGLQLAAGDVVAFIDDDAVPREQWLEKLLAAFTRDDIAAAGGWCESDSGRPYRICTCTRDGDVNVDAAPPVSKYIGKGADPFLYLPGSNMSFRRCLLQDLGGFNESLGYGYDDVDVCQRLLDEGYAIAVLEDAVVDHYCGPNVVRDATGIIRDISPIVRAKLIFILQSQPWRTAEEVRESLAGMVNGYREMADRYLAEGIFDAPEHAQFLARLDAAIDGGILEGKKGRIARQFHASQEGFRPFVTHDNVCAKFGRKWFRFAMKGR